MIAKWLGLIFATSFVVSAFASEIPAPPVLNLCKFQTPERFFFALDKEVSKKSFKPMVLTARPYGEKEIYILAKNEAGEKQIIRVVMDKQIKSKQQKLISLSGKDWVVEWDPSWNQASLRAITENDEKLVKIGTEVIKADSFYKDYASIEHDYLNYQLTSPKMLEFDSAKKKSVEDAQKIAALEEANKVCKAVYEARRQKRRPVIDGGSETTVLPPKELAHPERATILSD